MADYWYENYQEVVEFGSVLVERDGLNTARDVQYYYEKPHKYDEEHDSWEESGRAETWLP